MRRRRPGHGDDHRAALALRDHRAFVIGHTLIGGTQRAQASFDAAAHQIASVDLPTAPNPDPTNPVSPSPPRSSDVDIAGQMIAMTVAADTHHVTTAALRAAFSLYQDTLDLIPQTPVR